MTLRTLLVATTTCAVLTGTALIGPPVSADGPDALVFTCSADIPGFGASASPQSDGTCANANGGVSAGVGLGDGLLFAGTDNFSAAFSYLEPPLTCPALGQAVGVAWIGPVTEYFSWIRLGAVAEVVFNDPYAGASDVGVGIATLVVHNPLSDPCGHHVTAQVAGVALGTQ
jgi:hypothetical protein